MPFTNFHKQTFCNFCVCMKSTYIILTTSTFVYSRNGDNSILSHQLLVEVYVVSESCMNWPWCPSLWCCWWSCTAEGTVPHWTAGRAVCPGPPVPPQLAAAAARRRCTPADRGSYSRTGTADENTVNDQDGEVVPNSLSHRLDSKQFPLDIRFLFNLTFKMLLQLCSGNVLCSLLVDGLSLLM